jgi:antitoxin PrlF
MSLLVILN